MLELVLELELELDLGLEHHSETIGALSAAAGKELAIEEAKRLKDASDRRISSMEGEMARATADRQRAEMAKRKSDEMLTKELALKKEVAIPDIIAGLKTKCPPDTHAQLDRYLDKYNKGSLKPAAVNQLLRKDIGCDKIKEVIEELVPGFTRSWSPSPHEHPIIV